MSNTSGSSRLVCLAVASQLLVFGNTAFASSLQADMLSASSPTTSQKPAVIEAPAADLGMSAPGTDWSLPSEGKLDANGKPPKAGIPMLSGTVTAYDCDNDFGQLIDSLLDGALYNKDPKMTALDKSMAKYRSKTQERVAVAKDSMNFFVPWRGNGPSSEAADVILEEKIRVKDKYSAEYARQRYIDEVHPQVVARTLQLAMALGEKDPVRHDEMVQSSTASLAKLVGQTKAELALQKLQSWNKDVQVPNALYDTASSWDVDFFHNKLQSVTKLAMDGDPVMKQIVTHLQKYNHTNAVRRASSHFVEGGLSLASWIAPGYVVPLAIEAVNCAYVQATGGSEESKLLKELYYDKRVESRYRAINDEAQLALSQYQNALNVKNPALLVCCESVLSQLVGAENISQVLGGRTLLTHHVNGSKTIETAQNPNQSVQ